LQTAAFPRAAHAKCNFQRQFFSETFAFGASQLTELAASTMATKPKIEVFSAGCPLCLQAIEMVRREAGSSSEIIIRNMTDARDFGRATALGVRSVPAIAIDGKLMSSGGGVDVQILRDVVLARALH
jgi:glutaredoxin 3